MNDYWDIPERPIDPPDYDEPSYADDTVGILDFEVRNVAIVVDEDGYWDFEDTQAPWADKVDTIADTAYGSIDVDDGEGIRDAVYDVLEEHAFDELPKEPGRYLISCDVTLVYIITNVTYEEEYDYEGDVDQEYYTEDAEAELDKSASDVYHLQVVPQ